MRCAECGVETAEATPYCVVCGAPAVEQLSVVAGWPGVSRAGALSGSPGFSITRLRPGYDMEQVDAFLGAVRDTFSGVRQPPLTAEEIRAKKFATTRLRPGYDEEEVDAFLAEAEARLRIRCAERGAQTAEGTQCCAQCEAPTTARADPPGRPAVAQARQQALEDARVEPAELGYEIADAAGGVQATMPSVAQPPPIRTRMAFAGAGTALFAGIVGLIAAILFYSSYEPAVDLFIPAAYLLLITVAVVTLVRINRLLRVALLQGMWWPAVAFVASDIVSSSVYHAWGYTGRFLAAYWTLVASDALGAAAALLLVVSWSPAVNRRRGSQLGPLPVMLLCGVGLSQIAAGISYATEGKNAASYTAAIAGLLVGLAVTWYAMSLQITTLGGALVLGWTTVTALNLLSSMSPWTVSGALGCVLLAAVIILAFIYMRRPSDQAPSRSPSDP